MDFYSIHFDWQPQRALKLTILPYILCYLSTIRHNSATGGSLKILKENTFTVIWTTFVIMLTTRYRTRWPCRCNRCWSWIVTRCIFLILCRFLSSFLLVVFYEKTSKNSETLRVRFKTDTGMKPRKICICLLLIPTIKNAIILWLAENILFPKKHYWASFVETFCES